MSDLERFDKLREEYEGTGLDGPLPSTPGELLDQWLAAAAGLPLSNAMALATATPGGVPSVRMVLLKNVDEDGRLWFFTDYESQKGSEIDASPTVSALFYWQPLHRQIRITGPTERLDAVASDDYFGSRPRASQLSAIASHQSQVLPSRRELDEAREALDASGAALDRPERWGGYAITPETFEFWQGRADRLHHRLQFVRTGAQSWEPRWLAP